MSVLFQSQTANQKTDKYQNTKSRTGLEIGTGEDLEIGYALQGIVKTHKTSPEKSAYVDGKGTEKIAYRYHLLLSAYYRSAGFCGSAVLEQIYSIPEASQPFLQG